VFKAFIYGLLVGVILTGIGWFFIGRNNIGKIRTDFDRVSGDFEGVQRNSDQLTTDSDGFAGDITIITETSKRIESRSVRIDEGLTSIDGDIGLSIAKVDELEQHNKRLIHIGRDIGTISFDLKQLNKDSREKE
jgi:hypothetical protein